jgi:hypothetical protein
MSELKGFEEVGAVKILAARVYPLDARNNDPLRTEVAVEPGTYRVFSDGLTTFWLLHGRITSNSFRRGDGLFFISSADDTVDIDVLFPSCSYGPDELAKFLADDVVCRSHRYASSRDDR